MMEFQGDWALGLCEEAHLDEERREVEGIYIAMIMTP